MLGMPAFFWTQSGTCAPAQKVAMLKSHATLFKEMTSEIQPGREGGGNVPFVPSRRSVPLMPKGVCGLKVVVCSQSSSRLMWGPISVRSRSCKRLPRLLLLCATFGLVMWGDVGRCGEI